MYRKELNSLLKISTPRATLLYGESNFFIKYYSDKIATKITIPANRTIFYYSEYDFKTVMSILGQSSLFGDENLVILKLDKKLPKKEIDEMLKALVKNTQNSLIIEFYHSESKSDAEYAQDFRAFAGTFKGKGVVEVRFFIPSFYEAIALLKERVEILELDIDDRLLNMILTLQNNDLDIAYNELEKFRIFNRPITIEDIQKLCYGLGSVSIDEFFDTLFDKKDFVDVYEKMQEEVSDELQILREMERYFYQLFLFFAYIKTYGIPNAKEILGFNPPQNIVEKLASRAIRIKEESYQEIFERFRKWRNASMRGEKNASLTALIKIQATIR